MSQNLNQSTIPTDGYKGCELDDNSTHSHGCEVVAYFRDIEKALIANIKNADFVVGCIAWLTNERVIDALAECPSGCAIVVQKEDFLRPDGESKNGCALKLRERYAKLSCGLVRYNFDGVLACMTTAGDPGIEPVRCVGNVNHERNPAFPRMHNKFMVFCRTFDSIDEDGFFGRMVVPYAVWTGSYNVTKNAEMSFENCVYIQDESGSIPRAYMREFEQIMALSEPLDWEAEWMQPEWRIGT